jgi:putative ABC transport system permease protein
MTSFRQTLVLTGCALRGMLDRRGAALVTVISVTTVVGVLVSLLALREGTAIFGAQSAPPDVMVVMGRGARNPFMSTLSRDAVQTVSQAPGVKRTPDGRPYAYTSVMVAMDAIRKDGRRGTVFVAGYSDGATLVETDVHLIGGRWYEPGVHELLVPQALQEMYRGMALGDEVTLRGTTWKIVGVLANRNSLADSFLRADTDSVMPAFGIKNVQQVTLKLDSVAVVDTFKQALAANPAIAVDARSRAQVNEENFGSTSRLLTYVAYSIGGVMALGAIFGALNSLYASIDARRRELATLRAIGFNSSAIIISVLGRVSCSRCPARCWALCSRGCSSTAPRSAPTGAFSISP